MGADDRANLIGRIVRKGRLVFFAALSRFAVAGIALLLLSVLGAETRRSTWVLWIYLGYAAIEQVLIRYDVGGRCARDRRGSATAPS